MSQTLVAAGYPVGLVCRAVGLARSSYYHAPSAPDETALRAALLEAAVAWPTYGYRRLTHALARAGQTVNSKVVRRLMAELHLTPKKPLKKVFTTNSRHPFPRFPNLVAGRVIDRRGQVLVGDITYVRLRRGFVFLAVLMDVYTRQLWGWELSRSLDHTLTLAALERAVQQGVPEIHHSDQGMQYAATQYVTRLQALGVQLSMAAVGRPDQNAYAERLIRTIKEEEVYLADYADYSDAYQQLSHFLQEVYNHKRIHSALGYLTPIEFAQTAARPAA